MRALGVIVALAGCTRDAAEAVCPDVGVGELAVTEVRGKQSDDTDTGGQWIEIYNATSGTVDLEGLVVKIRKMDGTSEADVIVRHGVPVAANGYAVLGLFDDAMRPSYVDYGFLGDYHQSWLAAAAIDLDACTVKIDRVTYNALPPTGTYSLAVPPSADKNDLSPSWCTDPTPAGTPQQANPMPGVCP